MVDTKFFNNKGPFTLAQIAEICEAELEDKSKADIRITDLATMFNAKEGEICFFFDKKKKAAGADIKATACVTTSELAQYVPENVIKLISDNPHLGFVKLNYAMYEAPKPVSGISPKASVSPTAEIGKNCYIGDFAVIEDGVKLGDDCVVEAHVTIGRNCQIGSRCHIGAGAGISHCIMGDDCYIYGGARIGWDGFGFMTLQGQHKRIPQLGRVIIGNDVEIGANSCVDRGALDDTIIGDGCRIDDLVMVAHNVKLGRGCILVSQTGIAGSCTFGDYVVCGGQTGFADHLNIGSGVQVGAQSGIMRDIESGMVVMGTPAVPIKDFMRQVSYVQKLSKK
ncbi:MAG: UDP-3-O-(3-hydroxymyristoyl)glucosamine N-acyltransferase [Alphaproteobacteria bacterium]|nr:UDP-3-O-(3-hydroxymyristoyl)glucosamine N-acyltransferase [Alphaproteobacteria bacterium]